MPSLRVRAQQPSPVPAQVELPPEFPPVPQAVLDRFPEAEQWQAELKEFWTRTKQSIQSAQTQAANYANARVVYSVDQFLIYAKGGIPQPMFALDSTGVKLGNVLTVNTPGRRVYIGAGTYNDADTPFYVDANGFFSLGDQLTWDPETGTLTVAAVVAIIGGTIGGFDIGADYIRDAANSFGLSSTVTGGDDVRFWAGDTFANRATAPFRVTEAGNITANNATIVGTISGRSTATIAAAIDSAGDLVTDLINARLDTDTKRMLSDFTFGTTDYSGALKSGTITWNTTTGAITGGDGVLVYRGGIIGASAGVATFAIDAATGAATFAGALSAPTGNIGGFTLGADFIRDAANSMGLASTVTGGDDVRFWAGAAFASRATAPFRVTESGAVVATSATITGTITATTGTIGGWTVGATTLTGGSATLDSTGVLTLGTGSDVVILSAPDATYRLWIGNATAGSAPFRVTKAGVLTATGATITGTITATTGAIGGFDIGTDYIRDAANSMGLASTVTGGDDVRFWAGATFASRASAPFFVTEAGNITANNATIVGTVSGRSTATLAAAINSSGNLITDLINARLDSSAKTMLSDFTFGAADYSGALKSGTITWNTTTGAITGGSGVLVFRGGIIASASGVATITLDAATGSATFAGALSAPTGNIGGFTLGADYIRDAADSMGLASTVTGGDDVRFWAGAAFASRGTAPFRVTEAGALVATSATITGAITATSGAIGGFTIGSDYIRDAADSFGLASTVTGGDDVRFWAGATFTNRATAPFRVTEAGALTSTSGTIGGFTIGSTTLTAGTGINAIRLDSAGYIIVGDSTFGSDDSVLISQNTVDIMGYSPNYWIKANGGNGKIYGGTWTYGGSYSFGTILELDFSSGDYKSYGGISRLYTAAAGLRITLDGTNGNGTFYGTVDVGTGGYLVSSTKVVGAQEAARADVALTGVYASDFNNIEDGINDILARLRNHGLIAT